MKKIRNMALLLLITIDVEFYGFESFQLGILMIFTRIRLIARAEKRLELLQTAESLSEKIAQEIGCLNCEVYQNTSNPREIVISEEWDSEVATRRHLDSKSLAVLAGAGSILSTQVEVFTGSDQPMRDMQVRLEKRLKKY